MAKALNMGSWWIGATDADSEGTWTWMSGTPWSYTDWKSGEPNDYTPGEDCVVMLASDDYKWNDIPCYYNVRPICQIAA